MWPFFSFLFQVKCVRVEEGVCGKPRIGGDKAACVALAAGHADAVVEDLGVVLSAVVLLLALAVDFTLGVKVIDNEHDDVADLAVCDCILLLLLGELKAFDTAFLHEVEQFKFTFGKFCSYAVDFAEESDVHAGIGAGEGKKVFAEKKRRRERKMVILAAHEAGNRQMHFILLGRDDRKRAFAAGTFEFDHAAAERKDIDGAQDASSAMRATIGKCRSFFGQYHKKNLSLIF